MSTGQGIIGYNMFAYCGNNPIVRRDNGGEAWTLIIGAGISALLSGIDMAICANMSGQNVWKGFIAGVIGGTIGFAAGLADPLFGRMVGTIVTSLANELLQYGTLQNMDVVAFIWDVLFDTCISTLYVDWVAGVSEKQLGNMAKQAVSSALGGLLDGIVDVGETEMYNNVPLSQNQNNNSGKKNSYSGKPAKFKTAIAMYV